VVGSQGDDGQGLAVGRAVDGFEGEGGGVSEEGFELAVRVVAVDQLVKLVVERLLGSIRLNRFGRNLRVKPNLVKIKLLFMTLYVLMASKYLKIQVICSLYTHV
jgi:hypothetical protein